MKNEENPLRAASELARAGRPGEAIACLEAALARSRLSASRPANTPLLAKAAGLFCEQGGDLLRSASYYNEAIATEGPEPFTLVALADVYFRIHDPTRLRLALGEQGLWRSQLVTLKTRSCRRARVPGLLRRARASSYRQPRVRRLADHLPNAACTTALIDRLVHHSESISIEGESYRKREAELAKEETTTRRRKKR